MGDGGCDSSASLTAPPQSGVALNSRTGLRDINQNSRLSAAIFDLFLASLVCDAAAGLARRLARGLALAAATVLCAVAEALGCKSLDTGGLALALLVSDTAAGLASGLAGGLALAAAAVLCAVAKALGI